MLNGLVGRWVGQTCGKELLDEACFGRGAFEYVIEYAFDYDGEGISAAKNLYGKSLDIARRLILIHWIGTPAFTPQCKVAYLH